MATEQHRVVIDVDYIGDRDIQRYIEQLQRLGAVSDNVAERLRGLNSSNAPSSLEIARQLDAASASAMTFESRAQAAISSTSRLQRETEALRTSLTGLQQAMARPVGEDSFRQMRQQLADVLQANMLVREIQSQGSLNYANAGMLPGGRPAGVPQYRLNEMSGAFVAPPRESIAQAQRLQRAQSDSTQATLDFSRATAEATSETRRTTQAQRRLQRVVAAATEQAVAMPALPAGTGRQPRRGDFGMTPAHLFLSRDRANELAAQQYLDGLRQRIAAERSMTEATNRAARFQDRVGGILERPGAELGFNASGATQVAFTETGETLRRLNTRLQRLEATVARAEQDFRVNSRELRQATAATNSAQLGAMASSARAGGEVSYKALDFLDRLASMAPGNPASNQLLYHGEVTTGLFKGIAPDVMSDVTRALFGENRELDITARRGEQIPGLMSQDQVLQTMRSEALGPLYAEMRGLRQQQAQYMLPLGATAAAAPMNAQTVLRAQTAVAAFGETVLMAVEAERRYIQARRQAEVAAAGEALRPTGPLYHGTSKELPSRLLPTDQIRTMSNGQLFGPGFYTTTDMGIANEYSRTRVPGSAFGGGQLGYRYEVQPPPNMKVFDLDSIMSMDDVRGLGQALARAVAAMPNTPDRGALQAAHESMTQGVNYQYGEYAAGRNLTWAKMTGNLLNDEFGIAGSVVQKYLQQQFGPIDAFTHKGGQITGGREHQVYIFSNPEQFRQIGDLQLGVNNAGSSLVPYQPALPRAADLSLNPIPGVGSNLAQVTGINPRHQAIVDAVIQKYAGQVMNPATAAAINNEILSGIRSSGGQGWSSGSLVSTAVVQQYSDAVVNALRSFTATNGANQQLTEAVRRRAAAEQRAAAAAAGSMGGTPIAGTPWWGGGQPPRALPPGRGGTGAPPPPPGGGWGTPGGPGASQYWANEELRNIADTQQKAYDAVMRARAGARAADLGLEEVLNKGDKGIGVKGGYATQEARARAFDQAFARVDAAYQRLEKAIAHEARMREGVRGDPADTGRFHGPLMPLSPFSMAQVDNAAIAAGAMPRPATQTPIEKAQSYLAQTSQQLADAQAAHTQVTQAHYKNQAEGQVAYAQSLGNLTRAQAAHTQAQQDLVNHTNRAANQARWQQGAGYSPFGAGYGPAYSRQTPGGVGGGGGGTGIFGGAMAAGAPGGGGGGMFGDFMYGFHGRQDRSYMEQLGQTFKFSVFYGAAYKLLFAITQTLQATLAEGIAWEQSMTDLRIATGRTNEELEAVAGTVSRTAVEAGLAPSQGLAIATRAQGLYGVTDSTAEEQDRVARISTQVISRMSTGSKTDPLQLQANVAAVVQALGMDPSGQQRIADVDAYMAKKFGVDQGAALEAVAQSASVGIAAGFSQEELQAIAALMMSRTGQTSSAVGGFMAQIFSRGGEGSLVDVAKKQGIDPNQDLRAIIGQLAGLYGGADAREQAEISAAFGRGKIQNAAVALLGDYDEVASRSAQARTDATGMADTTFRERMNNIGGEIAVLAGLFKEFASAFGQSGMLDIVGAGVLILQEVFESLNGLLGLWNQLGDVTQDVVIGMALLLAAIRSETLQRAVAGRMSGFGMAAPAGAYGTGPSVRIGPGGVTPVATGGLGGAAAMARAGGAFRAVGSAMWAMTGPIGLAIGGLLAVGSLASSTRKMDDAMLAASDDLSTGVGVGADASAYRNRASQLEATAGLNREASGGFWGMFDSDGEAIARVLEAEADRLNSVAERIEQDVIAGGSVEEASNFRSFAQSDISAGLEAITSAGGTAQERMRALEAALYGTAFAAEAAEAAFHAGDFADQMGGDLAAAASAASETAPAEYMDPASGYLINSTGGKIGLVDEVQKALTGGEAAKRLKAALDSQGVESLADLDEGTINDVAALVGDGIADGLPMLTPEGKASMQAAINEAIAQRLREQVAGAAGPVTGDTRLSTEDATSMAMAAVAESGAIRSGLQETDVSGRISESRRLIRALRRTQRRTDDPNAYIQAQLSIARRELAQAQFEEFEGLRQVAMQHAKNKKAANAIGKEMLVNEINAAIKGGNADLLVEIVRQAGMGARSIVKKSIEEARAAAREAIRQAQLTLSAIAGMGVLADPLAQFDENILGLGGDPEAKKNAKAAQAAAAAAQKTIDDLGKIDKALGSAASAGPDNNVYSWKGMDVYNPEKARLEEEAEEDKETAAERAAARAQAYASRSQGAMDAARANIMSAQAAIAKADANSVEYWNAMGQLFEAQNALAQAQRDYQNNLRLLSIDITNPLEEARVATQAAAQKLREDLASGKADDVIAQDRVDLKRAQASQEATAFQQRLTAVQTAEELGRISHGKYLNYLEREKRRLEAISNRTFQQQEQLDQVDRLLQDAASQMQAQWNFGDIKMPTPYQMRRFIEEASGAKQAKSVRRAMEDLSDARSTRRQNEQSTGGVTFTMYVNGGDVATIKREVRNIVGKPGRTLTTAPRRGR